MRAIQTRSLPKAIQDHIAIRLLMDAARLSLRSGAGPHASNSAIQQRHQLVQQVAEKSDRHIVLLTATPHSGIETSFLSLLGFLQPEFEQLNLESLGESDRIKLANHSVQRRRVDVKQWLLVNA